MNDEVKIVLSLQLAASMVYLQMLPFFPQFLRKKGIDKIYLGLGMSVFSFAFIFSSLFTGRFLLKRIKRINGSYTGACFLIINMAGLGTLDYLNDKNIILYSFFILQVLGGIGNGLSSTSSLALLSSYKDQRQTYISYWEMISCIGTIVGPTIGACFYYVGGFNAPFYGIGTINLLLLSYFLIKQRMIRQNNYRQYEGLITIDLNEQKKRFKLKEIL